MDLSVYYEEFKNLHSVAIFAVIAWFFAMIFLCIRRWQDTKPRWKRILFYVGYIFIFLIILTYYFRGPYLCKKDIDQQSIYGYEGEFEIVEVIPGIYDKAVFLIDGEEICLKYFEDDGYDVDLIKPGEYEGKIIYAQHISDVLYIEIYHTEE